MILSIFLKMIPVSAHCQHLNFDGNIFTLASLSISSYVNYIIKTNVLTNTANSILRPFVMTKPYNH